MKKLITNNIHWFVIGAVVLACIAIYVANKNKPTEETETKNTSNKEETEEKGG